LRVLIRTLRSSPLKGEGIFFVGDLIFFLLNTGNIGIGKFRFVGRMCQNGICGGAIAEGKNIK